MAIRRLGVVGGLVLVAGLIAAGSVEFLSRPVVDSHSVPAGNNKDIVVTFVSERSRLLKRTSSRLVFIEGKGAQRDHNPWIWGHAPREWNSGEVALISDAEGTRPCRPSVFRLLWGFADMELKDAGGLLRQVADESRDEALIRFLRRHEAHP